MALVETLTFSSFESKAPVLVGVRVKFRSSGAEREITGLMLAESSWVD